MCLGCSRCDTCWWQGFSDRDDHGGRGSEILFEDVGPGGPWGTRRIWAEGRALQSREPLGAWSGAVPWALLTSLSPLSFPLPPSLPPLFLPSSLILPSSPPEPLWLSGTRIRMLLLTEQHSPAGGPLGEGVGQPPTSRHTIIYSQSLAWKHAVSGASFVTKGDKISSLLSPPRRLYG